MRVIIVAQDLSDAVAGAEYPGVGDAIGKADAGREPALADVDSAVGGHRACAASQNLVCVGIVTLDAAVAAGGNGEVFPAQAVIQRQLRIDIPAVARIEAVKPGAKVELIRRLKSLPYRLVSPSRKLA